MDISYLAVSIEECCYEYFVYTPNLNVLIILARSFSR